jgi:hypothetical protein
MPERSEDCQDGGIIGAATLRAVVRTSSSPWFRGRFGLVLVDPIVLPFMPLRGQLGWFDVPLRFLPDDIKERLQPGKSGGA